MRYIYLVTDVFISDRGIQKFIKKRKVIENEKLEDIFKNKNIFENEKFKKKTIER
jgi:hypothetical protein